MIDQFLGLPLEILRKRLLSVIYMLNFVLGKINMSILIYNVRENMTIVLVTAS